MCLNFSLHENIQAVTKPRILKNQQIYCHLDLRVYDKSLSCKNNTSEDVFLSMLLYFQIYVLLSKENYNNIWQQILNSSLVEIKVRKPNPLGEYIRTGVNVSCKFSVISHLVLFM